MSDSGFVELLTGKFLANQGGNGAADSNRNKFTVNTAVNNVSLDVASAQTYMVFQKPYGAFPRQFKARDQIRILSIGIMTPYGFEIGDTPICLEIFKWYTSQLGGSANLGFPEFYDYGGSVSSFTFPFVNYEFAVDVVSPFDPQTLDPATNPVSYLITCKVLSGNLSMVGVNNSLNALTLPIIPFIKVLHSIPVNAP